MPGLDGTGPMGDGRPGRGLGRCSKTRQTQRSDKEQPSGMRPETDASFGREARRGGGRGLQRGLSRDSTCCNLRLDEGT